MSTIVRPISRYRRLALSAPPTALAVTLLAGCGGGNNNVSDTAAPAANTQNDANTGGRASAAPNSAPRNGANRTFPGASGEIAEIAGKTLQVQNTTSQTAVTYTDSTKITNSVTATKADLSVGDCVSVRDTAMDAVTNAGGSTEAPTGQPTPAAVVDPNTAVEAASVTISDAVDGVCPGGFGGGGFPGGFGGNRPQAGPRNGQFPQGGQFPQAAPNGSGTGNGGGQRPDGARAFGGGASGKVTKIDGNTVTVETTHLAAPNADGSQSTASPTTSTRTVTLVATTTYTKTVSATPSALKVGSCVTAFGTANDTGAISASSIAISSPVDGSCTSTGFGRFGGANRGTNGAAPAAGASNG
jgi:hypothetical protein